jgi:hypothetical protein
MLKADACTSPKSSQKILTGQDPTKLMLKTIVAIVEVYVEDIIPVERIISEREQESLAIIRKAVAAVTRGKFWSCQETGVATEVWTEVGKTLTTIGLPVMTGVYWYMNEIFLLTGPREDVIVYCTFERLDVILVGMLGVVRARVDMLDLRLAPGSCE